MSHKLDVIRVPRIISSSKRVVILIDTTYWRRNFGVVVFKDCRTKRVLWRKFVRYETLSDYKKGIDWLEKHGFNIEGIVCNGMRGLFQFIIVQRDVSVSSTSYRTALPDPQTGTNGIHRTVINSQLDCQHL